ncbi:hypothetical protein KIL84_004770 [Mauremys mutica]|uniref:Uncharacterized protein n=1 Tax=Mauremys mutica TaxID=74926 RepID=A0A9D3XQ21_9SAUR|nr:hypothetical protein KIL84_004770 [Mauremys mutica]
MRCTGFPTQGLSKKEQWASAAHSPAPATGLWATKFPTFRYTNHTATFKALKNVTSSATRPLTQGTCSISVPPHLQWCGLLGRASETLQRHLGMQMALVCLPHSSP